MLFFNVHDHAYPLHIILFFMQVHVIFFSVSDHALPLHVFDWNLRIYLSFMDPS